MKIDNFIPTVRGFIDGFIVGAATGLIVGAATFALGMFVGSLQ